ATVSPDHPTLGDIVILTYNPGAQPALHKDVSDLTAEVLLARESEMPLLLEVPLRNEREHWKGSFKLDDANARTLLIRYISGDEIDDNGGHSWDILVYSKAGIPLQGAYLMRSMINRSDNYFGFKRHRDDDAAWTDLAEEQRLYPQNWRAQLTGWGYAFRARPDEQTMELIRNELDDLYKKRYEDEEVVSSLLYWFDQTGQKNHANVIRSHWLKKNPGGKVAAASRQSEVFSEEDPVRKVKLLERFMEEFPQTDDNMLNVLISFCIQAELFDKAIGLLGKHPDPNPQQYSALAWHLIDTNQDLDKAMDWAKKGLELARKHNERSKPSYLSSRQWKRSREHGIGMSAGTYGLGLFKRGDFVEAERAFHEAYQATSGADVDINEHLVECYVKNRNHEEAMKVANECLRKGKANDSLIAHYKVAYIATTGSEEGFEAAVENARGSGK
ncbi:MAG: hypothetical protein HY563_07370, partial [Ignavibacteriales bacterium]|nr:hypothetical protein [Ignavibacteriales bacterium]